MRLLNAEGSVVTVVLKEADYDLTGELLELDRVDGGIVIRENDVPKFIPFSAILWVSLLNLKP